ncbi:membrane progestin receptor gamma isoform X4 [Sus scrofa]|uniref:membrane progestin receptor gamma isoform X4 n=1 Tax=Sus scrofa TaxID=9823 RepID=UPI000A2B0B7E|nr:membrane progestin receptor gamma isoform X4 [Sus scrofa]XP_020956259.1 membrane progestin receptor gamma isoform X4 [Sus scrofa]XP_020956262.1 membrane progestin receptor gamma isoform X4 [Sus scrofa]XP_020956270.1 membrane progestin receptor gamma isoform X4 [Sus scrofa]XP_020956280.1 membrane progestin receptor gamma isoform X4 [Sus scrofa]XP_020956285.1 membrane progestin receptor gamma isoform X4 [Sus scrofa]
MLSLKLPRLFSIEQMPQVFHEQGILFGYRHPQSSATACVLSLFQMTNETLNIWTHLLPFWFFMWRFVSTLRVTDILNDSYSWPLLVYMGASCVYPLASSCAHTFSSMSKNARHICYFLDYGAVNLFSLASAESRFLPKAGFSSPGSAIAYSAYVFPDTLVCTTFHDYYVALAVLNTVVSTGLSCYSRFLEIRKPGLCKILRVLAFAYPYTWDSLPIFSRLFLFPGESAQNEATMYHQKHMAMTLLASFFYSAHLPERLAPGRFDYIGHSHQLFHVCVILATHMQMEAILLDKSLRKEWLLANCKPLLFPQIAGAILLCLIFSLSNIIYFSAALYRIPEPELHKKET